MARNDKTSTIIDGLLQCLVAGGLLATTLVAPNALQALNKPLVRYFKNLDKRSQDREYRRLLRYMKSRGLIKYTTRDYEHGIQLTETGRKRAERAELEHISIAVPTKWDERWRIIFFDIPEDKKTARDYFSSKLKEIGFVQLQKSVWVHPFPCKKEIAAIAQQFAVRRFITYIETSYIDSQNKLKERFPFKL